MHFSHLTERRLGYLESYTQPVIFNIKFMSLCVLFRYCYDYYKLKQLYLQQIKSISLLFFIYLCESIKFIEQETLQL